MKKNRVATEKYWFALRIAVESPQHAGPVWVMACEDLEQKA
jgi:hypothetical protein